MRQNNAKIIVELKKELGRYMKKVDDDAELISRMARGIQGRDEQLKLQDALTSTLIRLQALQTLVVEEGKVLIPCDEITQGLGLYEVIAHKDEERGCYVLQVVERHIAEETGDA